MGDTLSQIKTIFKIAIFVKNIVSRLPTFWMLKSLFGPLIGRKKLLYISLPSIYVKCANGKNVQAYKKRGSMPGGVRTDLPWVRPHDSNAASNIKVLISDFVGDLNIVPDENIDREMIRENLFCIGGQTNWVFDQFVIKENYLLPLEYRIDQNKRFDGFYDLEMNESYESRDRNYSYGLLAVVRNTQAYNKRIVFISGLDADSTLEITIMLRDNLRKIYQKAKAVKLLRSDFYCICRFKRTGDRQVPLIFDDVFIRRISDKTTSQ